MTEHTPGPWILDRRGGCAGIKSSEPDNSPGMGEDYPSNLLAYTKRGANFDGMYWDLPDETIANMTLIAAAPDMLSALQNIVRALQDEQDGAPIYPDSPLAGCLDAIDKAIGV